MPPFNSTLPYSVVVEQTPETTIPNLCDVLTAGDDACGLNISNVGEISGNTLNFTDASFTSLYTDILEYGTIVLPAVQDLIFLPTDFINGSSGSPTEAVLSSQPDPRVRGKVYGMTTENVLVAQKIIPQDYIADGTSRIQIFTAGGTIIGTTCYVSAQDIAINSTTDIVNLLSSTGFTTNTAITLSGGGTITGDGRKVLTIYFDAGGSLPITTTNSLSGASVSLHT